MTVGPLHQIVRITHTPHPTVTPMSTLSLLLLLTPYPHRSSRYQLPTLLLLSLRPIPTVLLLRHTTPRSSLYFPPSPLVACTPRTACTYPPSALLAARPVSSCSALLSCLCIDSPFTLCLAFMPWLASYGWAPCLLKWLGPLLARLCFVSPFKLCLEFMPWLASYGWAPCLLTCSSPSQLSAADLAQPFHSAGCLLLLLFVTTLYLGTHTLAASRVTPQWLLRVEGKAKRGCPYLCTTPISAHPALTLLFPRVPCVCSPASPLAF